MPSVRPRRYEPTTFGVEVDDEEEDEDEDADAEEDEEEEEEDEEDGRLEATAERGGAPPLGCM